MNRFAGVHDSFSRFRSHRFFLRPTAALVGVCLLVGGVADTQAGPQSRSEMTGDRTVLFIGDSNTEYGYITGALKDIMINEFGDFGTGYYPFSFKSNKSAGRIWGWQGDMEGLELSIDTAQWALVDAVALVYDGGYDVAREDAPTQSPSTHWIESNREGASMSAEFTGSGFDLYWTSTQDGGTFEVSVDGTVVETVNTGGMPETKRTTITGLDPSQSHTAVMTRKSGNVILQGMDVRRTVDGEVNRAVVHTWANSGAAAVDFANVHEDVFSSALQLINPTYVVVMLGTNDATEEVSETEFRTHMMTIAERINEALPSPRLLIASCIDIKFDLRDTLGGEYLETSYPTVAQETDAEYWNLHHWFGPYQENKDDGFMKDIAHVNKKGGKEIAPQLWTELNDRFGAIGVIQRVSVSSSGPTALRSYRSLSGLSRARVPTGSLDLLGRKRPRVDVPSIAIIRRNLKE